MFQINGNNIVMSRGDTARFTFRATGHAFKATSRALFTVKAANGRVMFENTYPLTDGEFTVVWGNEVTDTWPSGSYSYDVRYVDDPVYADGRIVNGSWVETPIQPQSITILNTVGEV